jgi:hypothetical protein
VLETNPRVLETNPPVREAYPPVRETNPPARETNPPVRETNPPVRETNPPVRETNPPVRETNPPVRKAYPRVRKAYPRVRKAYPRVRKAYPRVHKAYPPVRKVEKPDQQGRADGSGRRKDQGVACHPGVTVLGGKEEGPYCPSSSAEAHAEEATVRSPLLTKMKFSIDLVAKTHGTADTCGRSLNLQPTARFPLRNQLESDC